MTGEVSVRTGKTSVLKSAFLNLIYSNKHSCGLRTTRQQSTAALKTGNGGFGQNDTNLKRDKNALLIFPKPCPSPTKSSLGQALSGNIF